MSEVPCRTLPITTKIFNAIVPNERNVPSNIFAYFCHADDLRAYAINPHPIKHEQGFVDNYYGLFVRPKVTGCFSADRNYNFIISIKSGCVSKTIQ